MPLYPREDEDMDFEKYLEKFPATKKFDTIRVSEGELSLELIFELDVTAKLREKDKSWVNELENMSYEYEFEFRAFLKHPDSPVLTMKFPEIHHIAMIIPTLLEKTLEAVIDRMLVPAGIKRNIFELFMELGENLSLVEAEMVETFKEQLTFLDWEMMEDDNRGKPRIPSYLKETRARKQQIAVNTAHHAA